MALAKSATSNGLNKSLAGRLEVILRFALSQPYAAKVGHERREI